MVELRQPRKSIGPPSYSSLSRRSDLMKFLCLLSQFHKVCTFLARLLHAEARFGSKRRIVGATQTSVAFGAAVGCLSWSVLFVRNLMTLTGLCSRIATRDSGGPTLATRGKPGFRSRAAEVRCPKSSSITDVH